jgi:hypothetical protein
MSMFREALDFRELGDIGYDGNKFARGETIAAIT